MIKVTISLQSTLVPSGSGSDTCQKPQFRIPIVIGSIPLEEPLRCEIQMALLTSARLLPWQDEDSDNEGDDEHWELVPDSDQEVELDPPPNLEIFFNHAETRKD